jgi:fucose 4-O-acetylase-like acetyltransferase
MDAGRSLAMLLSTLTHASISYVVVGSPDIAWHVQDAHAWKGADVVYWWIRAFDMQLFLVMSGFLAARAYDSRGPAAFAANRGRRIGLPFLAACLVVLPVMYVVWGAGWIHSGRATESEVLRMHFHDRVLRRGMWGPAHLWFLEYLLLMCAAYLLVRLAWERLSPGFRARLASSGPARLLDRLLLPPTAFLVPTLTSAAILLAHPFVYVSIENSFAPRGARFAYYVVYFLYGCWMSHHAADLRRFASGAWLWLAASVPAFLWVLDLVVSHPDGRYVGADRWALAAAGALAASTATFGIFALLLRHADRPSRVVRWISDSAFWVYLVHMPVVGAFQLLLADVDAPGWAKLFATLVGTYLVCFLSYRWLVRPTRLGVWLGGPAPARAPAPTDAPAPAT